MWRAQLLTQGGVDLLLTPALLCASLQSLHTHSRVNTCVSCLMAQGQTQAQTP